MNKATEIVDAIIRDLNNRTGLVVDPLDRDEWIRLVTDHLTPVVTTDTTAADGYCLTCGANTLD